MSKTHRTAYIAGPMRTYPRFNFPAFDEAAECLRSEGFKVVSPAEHDREQGFDETRDTLDGFDMKAALAWDLEQVVHADMVVLLPGWEKSVGVKAEKAAAEAAGVSLYVYLPDGSLEPLDEWHTPASGEVRVTNEKTGGAKGQKPQRYDLVPEYPLRRVAEIYGRGAEKYEDRNWEKGYDWNLSFAALNRHLWKFWAGEDDDTETQCPHLASVVFHAFALLQFGVTHPELDNRPCH